MASDTVTFIKELPKRFQEIGAILPSSAYLGKAMIRPLTIMQHPCRILEVGPGTGPFTRQVLRQMGMRDSFLICEINPQFVKNLKDGLQHNAHYRKHKDRVSFFQGPVQELRDQYGPNSFDFIVSSLPFTNFEPKDVEEILAMYETLLADGGALTFVEYVAVKRIAQLVRPPAEKERVLAVESVIKNWIEKHKTTGRVRTELTFLNLPPAKTVQLCSDASQRRELSKFRPLRQILKREGLSSD